MAKKGSKHSRKKSKQFSELGRLLDKHMKKKNTTTTKIAEGIGQSYSRINRIMRGSNDYKNPPKPDLVITLMRCSKELGLNREQFFELLLAAYPQLPTLLQALDENWTKEIVDIELVAKNLPQLFNLVENE